MHDEGEDTEREDGEGILTTRRCEADLSSSKKWTWMTVNECVGLTPRMIQRQEKSSIPPMRRQQGSMDYDKLKRRNINHPMCRLAVA